MTIDWWTLGIQAVNVIILVWLLARFFWRPVAAMIAQRRATAQQILTEAETKRSQAADALAEIERTRAGFEGEREAIIAAAHEAAEKARTTMLAAAAKEAATLETAARTAIEKERDAAEAAWKRAGRPARGRNCATPGRPPRWPGRQRRLPRLAASGDSAPSGKCTRRRRRQWRRARSDQRDPDRTGGQRALPKIDRRGIRSLSANQLQGGSRADRRPRTARPSSRRRQQLARRSRQDPCGPRA